MLKECPNNKLALDIKKILDGEMGCDTYNLRMCFYNGAECEREELCKCLDEMEEKLTLEQKKDPMFVDCFDEFKEKIQIYDDYFKLLEEREDAYQKRI